MHPSMSKVAQFKREARQFQGPRIKFDDRDAGYMRVNLVKPKYPTKEFVVYFGENGWPAKLGETFGFEYDGIDEDGNACWFVKPTDYIEP